METNLTGKPKLFWLVILWFVILVVWGLSGIFLHEDPLRGTFGDMFGAVNALFTGLAFATLIYTTWLQRDELSLQREELAATRIELQGQKEQLKQQSETFELQRFENSFFSLLSTLGEIVSAMKTNDVIGHTHKSRDCFGVFNVSLRKLHNPEAFFPSSPEKVLPKIQEIYETFYKSHQSQLGHYFRLLYQIIKFVKQSSISDKHRYTSIVRAQLSSYEQVMLFYNCLSIYGISKFKPLVEEFALLENMPHELLLNPKLHLPLYDLAAYGDDASKVTQEAPEVKP